MSKKIWYLAVVVLVVVVGLVALSVVFESVHSEVRKNGIEGVVIKRPFEYWGIDSSGWYGVNKFTIQNLPKEFQKEGARIKCKGEVADVIGSGEWDVYVKVSDCSLK